MGHFLHLAGGGHKGPHLHTQGSGTDWRSERPESTGLAQLAAAVSSRPSPTPLFCCLGSWEKFGFGGD